MPPYANYTGPCQNPKRVLNPSIDWFEPEPLKTDIGRQKLQDICPFLDIDGPLCCNDDQAYIMHTNFQQIDAVFSADVPMCGLNMKKDVV